MIFNTESSKETQKIASVVALKTIKSVHSKGAKVFALEGELGAGKTTFVQGFARALKIKQKINSPTFVLIKNYKLKTESYKNLWHIDAFRLKDWRELVPLGAKEMFAGPENIVLIEWSERIKPLLPKKHITIHFDHISDNQRKIQIINFK